MDRVSSLTKTGRTRTHTGESGSPKRPKAESLARTRIVRP
jgi:hypothetical protein